ncbi:hypothetical protein ACFT7S_07170 [Streptomyces sp. NPDC057136]|uniref:hypothetical protein n=1 Tax=Streptomyces sp. NPDC057136 TaxID=3346029 RepID=UPI0036320949
MLAQDVDRYKVGADILGRVPLAQATTAQEAVAAAVLPLPSGLGAVTLGADGA